MKTKHWNVAWVLSVILFAPHIGVAKSFDLPSDDFVVVFNQPKYAPGDTAYFMGYLQTDVNQSVGKKQIVTIHLLGDNNTLLLQERVLLIDGVGSNQLIIPTTVKPGTYKLAFFIETSIRNKQPALYSRALIISDKSLAFDKETVSVVDNSMLTIKLSSDTVKVRNKVNVLVTPGAAFKKNRSALLSVAVYNKKLFSDSNAVCHTILNMSPEGQATDSEQHINSSNNLDGPYYFMGRAVVRTTGNPVPDQSKITFYLNKSDLTYEISTQGGYFTFPLFRNFESERIFYRISYKGKILTDSQIIPNDFKGPIEIESYGKSNAQDLYGIYAHQKGIIKRSYDYFRSKQSTGAAAPDDDIDSDIEVDMEKFEPFASMAEVFSNVVQMVSYKKSKGTETIRVFLQKTATSGTHDPLYIINGVMTNDTRYVLTLDPRAVQKIGVLRTEKMLSRFGDLGSDGIVVIITREEIDGMGEEKNVLMVEGINNTLPYREFSYDDTPLKSRAPDLRPSLYWNSGLKFNEQASFDFYTSDDLGEYVIQIVGFQNGKPFIAESQFFVSK